MSKKIILTSMGSLGDLHPYLAIAVALREQGHRVVFATAADYGPTILAHGLEFAAIGPKDMSPFDPELNGRCFNGQKGIEYLHRDVIFPHVRQAYEELVEICTGADLLVSGSVSFVSPLVAHRLQIPWISSALQPSSILSAKRGVVPPEYPWLRHIIRLGPIVNAPILMIARSMLKSWQKPWTQLCHDVGFPVGNKMFMDVAISPRCHLALFSQHFCAPVSDWPASTKVTGWVFKDKRRPDDELSTGLKQFLDQGAVDFVFTAGSAAVHVARKYFTRCVEAARVFKKRCVFIAGEHSDFIRDQISKDEGWSFVTEYAPYSSVFERAKIVVHQCGMGTSGQVMRAGCLSLAAPFGADQYDNASQLERLGVAKFLPAKGMTTSTLLRKLTQLLDASGMQARAQDLAHKIRSEDGLHAASNTICEFW